MTDDPDLQDVIARERRLHDPAVRRAPEVAGELLDPDFREFGASGRVWDRASILAMMASSDDGPPVVADEWCATRLADDVVLLTYRTRRADRTALRSSLWRRSGGGPWRVVFHQATVQPVS
ncbi:DUF4440 domain-containing protein [Pseudonocardia broussonetiae]|uniref:Nuclear transport factor 2 family protein n=1 Tax=Pseudonocardia broussonetiae TaxID=2736640 RepID=A0A6M6JKD7_9PSEU|nr:DUF4440 domain-containing protein [Pseudonocardia broussonetiae]QJY47102.1 nuclear transport factor 2 family protein [Pseudonocardia broussonetiae]